jgi:hypothetical protein
VATSDSARRLLGGDSSARWAAVIVVLLYGFVYFLAAVRTSRISRRIATQLDGLAYMPREYYDSLVIERWMGIVYGAVNSALCIALITFILEAT